MLHAHAEGVDLDSLSLCGKGPISGRVVGNGFAESFGEVGVDGDFEMNKRPKNISLCLVQ